MLCPFGCRRAKIEVTSEPAGHARVEGVVRLTEETMAHIGIATIPAEARSLPATVGTTGWSMVIPGREITVKAPATGFLVAQEEADPITLGDAVTVGSKLAALEVFLSPQEEAQLVAMKEEVDILIRQSLASLDTAQARLERVGELSENGTLPVKETQLAKEAVDRAKARSRVGGSARAVDRPDPEEDLFGLAPDLPPIPPGDTQPLDRADCGKHCRGSLSRRGVHARLPGVEFRRVHVRKTRQFTR